MALVLANVLVELVLQGADAGLWGQANWRSIALDLAGFRPALLLGGVADVWPQALTMFLTYAFIHANFWHLAGNMLALVVFASEVEEWLGQRWTLVLYLLSAAAGGLAFLFFGHASDVMVGASGAIFGLAGAFVVRKPRQFWRLVTELAVLNALLWVMTGGALAWQAHLGGFLAGMSLAFIMRARGRT